MPPDAQGRPPGATGTGRRAVFLDRDGTLMEEVHYCKDPALVRAFPGTASALRSLREAGWLAIIVTNQSGIASGKILLSEYRAVEAELLRQLDGQIDAQYFCPDSSSAPTRRRKPGTGMLEEAAAEWGIDLSRSWMVGDKDIDIVCGRAAGCRTILVKTGYGASHEEAGADHVADDIVSAIPIILTTASIPEPA